MNSIIGSYHWRTFQKLMSNDPKNICVTKAEANLLKFSYFIPLMKFLWNFLKEKMREEFSRVATASLARLAFTNCKQCSDESLSIDGVNSYHKVVEQLQTSAEEMN